MNANKEKPVPVNTKAIWMAAWIVMLVIIAMIVRNCATSVYYGTKTEKDTVAYYYSQGEKTGAAGLEAQPTDLDLENPVLRKAYIKGYRDGWDVYKSGVKEEGRIQNPEE